MIQLTNERKLQPSMLARAEEIQGQIDQLSGRDLQLWSIGILLILVLASGLLALAWPNLQASPFLPHLDRAYLPQLFFGLISLIILGNIYLIAQKRALNATRHALIRELVLNERLESLSLIDPLTQLLNRRAVNELIPRETSRCNRTGTVLVLIAMDLDRFHEINEKFGGLEGDRLLVEFAAMLKRVFRGGDLVFRQGSDEFLALLPDTNEEQAIYPMQRLSKEVEQWNLNSRKGYELSFASAVAAYITGTDGEELLRTIDRKLYHKKHNLVPVF